MPSFIKQNILPFSFLALLVVSLIGVMTARLINPADRTEALHAEIRAYLLANPEVIFEAVAIAREREAEAQTNQDADLVASLREELFEDGYSYVGGNPEGDITIVEFLDYRCGYCRRAFEEVETLLSEDENIRFIIKEYPILGDASLLSSQFAIAVKQLYGAEAYKDVHNTLMAFSADPTPEALAQIALSYELDPKAVIAQMMSDEVQMEIDRTRELGAKMEVSGTPTFVIENAMVRGYVPLDDMRSIVAEQREK